MHGFGFTTADGWGPYDGVTWPRPTGRGPGDWVRAPVPSPLQGRVRAHRIVDLPYFLDAALWVVELDGDVRREQRLSSAARGRLVARVAGWDDACAADFAGGCADRASRRATPVPRGPDGELMRGYMDDLRRCITAGIPSLRAAAAAGYIGARLAAIAAGHGRHPEGAGEERADQARWLAARLGLSDLPD